MPIVAMTNVLRVSNQGEWAKQCIPFGNPSSLAERQGKCKGRQPYPQMSSNHTKGSAQPGWSGSPARRLEGLLRFRFPDAVLGAWGRPPASPLPAWQVNCSLAGTAAIFGFDPAVGRRADLSILGTRIVEPACGRRRIAPQSRFSGRLVLEAFECRTMAFCSAVHS